MLAPNLSQLFVTEGLLELVRQAGDGTASLRCEKRASGAALARKVGSGEAAPVSYTSLTIEDEESQGDLVLPVLVAEPPEGRPPYVLRPSLPFDAVSAEDRAPVRQPYLEFALERGVGGLLIVGRSAFKLLFARAVANYGAVVWHELPVTVVPASFDDRGRSEPILGKRIGIVGLGSLGSEVARFLALAGASGLVLVDPDQLEVRNVRRHICGIVDLGRSKCAAVADALRRQGYRGAIDFVEAAAHRERADEVRQRIAACELLVCAADSGVAAQFVNHTASFLRRPAVIASVQLRPEPLGEAVIVDGQGGGCFACLRLYGERRLKDARPRAHDPNDYPDPVHDAAAPQLPQYQIARVATMATDCVALASRGMESSVWYTPLEHEVAGFPHLPPRHVAWNRVNQEPGCLVCETLR